MAAAPDQRSVLVKSHRRQDIEVEVLIHVCDNGMFRVRRRSRQQGRAILVPLASFEDPVAAVTYALQLDLSAAATPVHHGFAAV